MKLLLLAAAVLITGCARPTPTVAVAPGLQPRLTPAAAEQLARDAFEGSSYDTTGRQDPPDVIAITAIPGGPTVAGYLAGVSWIVEMRGHFGGHFGGRCGIRYCPDSPRGSGAWVHISDDDGSVISLGVTD